MGNRVSVEQERGLEHIPVTMVRGDLGAVPVVPLPGAYRLRTWRPGAERAWAEVEVSVREFGTPEQALARFAQEFGPYPEALASRCLFVEDAAGRALGTATAWYNAAFRGEAWGRLHWVAVRPECQGQGLAKPLVTAALRRLAESHDRAYLTTQTTSARAVRLYLDLGFVPLVTTEACVRGWRLLAATLGHPALQAFVTSPPAGRPAVHGP